MSAPLFGEFDPSVLKKRPHIRKQTVKAFADEDSNSNLYPYEEMLASCFVQMHKQNVEASSTSRRIALPAINIQRKAKKTIISNFRAICEIMKRDLEHVKQYICTEQSTDASIDGAGGLVITGRLSQSQIEKLIIQYVNIYVKCPVCGSTDTKLEKKDRILFIICNQCTARRSVQQIKTGFRADTSKRRTRAPQ